MRTLGVCALLAAAALAGWTSSGRGDAASCRIAPVHYGLAPAADAGLRDLPWIAAGRGASRVVGYLFYYSSILGDGRVNRSDGLTIYTGGSGPGGGAMKILWASRRSRAALHISGHRLDGAGSFAQTLPQAGAGMFPSIIRIPQAGCWRLTIGSGKRRANVVLEAVAPPVAQPCDPSPVYRTTPHPRFGRVTWMPATPRSSGIVAVLFVGTVPGADSAVVYARGPTGNGDKYLWWAPHPSGMLAIRGSRIDGAGEFAFDAEQAYGLTPPVTGPVFPSGIDLPVPGCWYVTLRTGFYGAAVVFKAVPRL
jgi:hypothetical protein